MGTDGTDFHGFESMLIRKTRVYPCPDFKLSGSQTNHYIRHKLTVSMW
jgi:hypothetical protein